MAFNVANHAVFSPFVHNVFFHKRTVHASLSGMSISACAFLTEKRVTRAWYSIQLFHACL